MDNNRKKTQVQFNPMKRAHFRGEIMSGGLRKKKTTKTIESTSFYTAVTTYFKYNSLVKTVSEGGASERVCFTLKCDVLEQMNSQSGSVHSSVCCNIYSFIMHICPVM